MCDPPDRHAASLVYRPDSSYGADCSGYVGKIWQVPSSNNDLTYDWHPYSTANFVKSSSLWTTVSRSNVKKAGALVYNSNGGAHHPLRVATSADSYPLGPTPSPTPSVDSASSVVLRAREWESSCADLCEGDHPSCRQEAFAVATSADSCFCWKLDTKAMISRKTSAASMSCIIS